jgi:hypothetical protein
MKTAKVTSIANGRKRITEMDLETVKELGPQITEAVRKALAAAGLEVRWKGCTYGETYMEAKLVIQVPGKSPESELYKDRYQFLKLPPLGSKFWVRDPHDGLMWEYEIVGMTRGSKVLALGIEEQVRYRFHADSVRKLYAEKLPPAKLRGVL